jgi:hypothetical protein
MQIMSYIVKQKGKMLNYFYKEKENTTMIKQQPKISGSGKWAENQVIKDAHGWETDIASEGDLYVPVNGDSKHQADAALVEVKSQGSNRVNRKDGGYTCNQTRPINFATLVVCVSNMNKFVDCDYLVFPAMEVLRRKLPHAGQHTKDSMVCNAMRVTTRDIKMYGCGRHDLQNRIEEAYNFSEKHEAAELVKYEINRRKRDYERFQEENHILGAFLSGEEG